MTEKERGRESEVRLVPMRIAGRYSAGGVKLVPVAKTHREAWEDGITEAEANHIHPLVANVGCLCAKCYRLERKVTTAFPEQERS